LYFETALDTLILGVVVDPGAVEFVEDWRPNPANLNELSVASLDCCGELDLPFTGDMARVGVPDADIPLSGVEVLAGGFVSFKNASLLGDVARYVGEDEDLDQSVWNTMAHFFSMYLIQGYDHLFQIW